MEYLIGQKFGDRYTIRKKIGEGGMAVVFEAWDHTLETEVALKVMRSDLADHDDIDIGRILEKFELEIRCVVGVNHPHIVPILDRGEQDGVFYYAMRYVKGGSLSERLKERSGGLSQEEVVAILNQVGGALQRAHDAGLYHRDIKPSNILYEETASEVDYFLADFGIAKAVEDTSQPTVTITSSGTPGYMSPEQAFGDPFDHRTDVFSLGVATYEMVTGVRPFQGATLTALMRAVTTEDPAPPTNHNAKLPQMVSDVILKAMAREPANRYQSVREFVSAIGVAYEGIARTAVVDPIQRPPEPARRWWPIAVGALAIGVIAVVAVMTDSPPDQNPPSTVEKANAQASNDTPKPDTSASGPDEEPDGPEGSAAKPDPAEGPDGGKGGNAEPATRTGPVKPSVREGSPTNSPSSASVPANKDRVIGPVVPPPTGVVVAYGAETGDGLSDALRTIAGEFVQAIVKGGTTPRLVAIDQVVASDPSLLAAELRQLDCELVVYLHGRAPKNVADGVAEAELRISVQRVQGESLFDRALPQTDSNPAKAYKMFEKHSAYVSAFRRALAEVPSGSDNPSKLGNAVAPEVVKALQEALRQD